MNPNKHNTGTDTRELCRDSHTNTLAFALGLFSGWASDVPPPSLPTPPARKCPKPAWKKPPRSLPRPSSLPLFILIHKGDPQNESAKQVYVLLPAVTQNGEDLATLWVARALWRTSTGYLWWWEWKNTALFFTGVLVGVCVCRRGVLSKETEKQVLVSSLTLFLTFSFVVVVLLLFVRSTLPTAWKAHVWNSSKTLKSAESNHSFNSSNENYLDVGKLSKKKKKKSSSAILYIPLIVHVW